MSRLITLYVSILSICILACSDSDSTLFTKLPSSKTNIDFKNLLRESEEFNVLNFGYFYNGGGVAVGDVNNDSLPDIYFTGNMMASKLYLNQGDFKFKEIAESAGVKADGLWNTGVTMVDINADGWLDIYVCRSAAALGARRKNQLFINNKNLTFSEQSALYGLDDQSYSTQAAFFDYDRDGDLDMYLLNHSVQQYAGFGKNLSQFKNQRSTEYGDKLYENRLFPMGDGMIGRFHDVTAKSGINSTVLGFGLGVAVDDLNGDGWMDIYVSNDYNEEDYVYINQQDGTFKNDVVNALDQSSLFSMGNDVADLNGDGLVDILTLDMLPEKQERIQMTSGTDNYNKKQLLYEAGFHKQSMRNMLQLNNGDGTFSEVGQLAGISNTDWSWAGLIEDYDLDGDNDIFVTNGYKSDYTNMDFMSYAADQQIKSQQTNQAISISNLIEKIPSIEESNYMYSNGGNLSFQNVTTDWGLENNILSNGAAYADFDNDGDLDLVVNHVNEKASIYRNNSIANSGVKILLKGSKSNPNAIGAKVELYQGETLLSGKRVSPTRGFQSSVEPLVVFSKSLVDKASKIKVSWPDGAVQEQSQVSTTENIEIEYELIDSSEITQLSTQQGIEHLSSIQKLPYSSIDNEYNDFTYQRLMPFKMSDRGMKMASGDLNGDGLDDVYLCGSQDQNGSILYQTDAGKYRIETISKSDDLAFGEEMDAKLFDMDSDGDLDLMLAFSNFQSEISNQNLGFATYENDGKGRFKFLVQKNLAASESYSSIDVADVDNDGDQDVFLGGFLKAKQFPISSQSMLLLNDGEGIFSEGDISIFDRLEEGQMVTDAKFVDLDSDRDLDLVVVGHWAPITICTNNGSSFDCEQVEGSEGLWNVIESKDLNGDGKEDLIIGNYGLNSQLKASKDSPLTLHCADFDDNGTLDPLMCKTIDGKLRPLAFRDDLIAQLPGLKKSFNSYEEYAKASLDDIFTKEQLDNAISKKVSILSSVVLMNDDAGRFIMNELPWQAQVAPVFAIEASDVNQDGNVDLLLGGNQLGAMEQLGPNLSNKLVQLNGKAKGGFESINKASSSLGIKGEIRDIQSINNESYLISLRNDSLLILNLE